MGIGVNVGVGGAKVCEGAGVRVEESVAVVISGGMGESLLLFGFAPHPAQNINVTISRERKFLELTKLIVIQSNGRIWRVDPLLSRQAGAIRRQRVLFDDHREVEQHRRHHTWRGGLSAERVAGRS